MSELKHYGTPRHSGRYPYGSGKDPEQRNPSIRGTIKDLRKKGLTEKQIAEGFGMTTTELRAQISIEKSEQLKADSAMALRLKEKGYSNVAIGDRMGINESSVRNLLNPALQERALVTENTANMLKEQIQNKQYLDVGAGVETHLGISRTKLNTAIAELEDQGYKLQYVQVEQLGTGKKTSLKVLTKEDVPYQELYQNKDKIRTITDWSEDGGQTWTTTETPKSISSDRIKVRFAEEGGADMDGVIQLRRGVPELSLGDAKYAQVRIAVDNDKYMKGMAIYSDDMPKGVDIIYNSNKSESKGKDAAFKSQNQKILGVDGTETFVDKEGKAKVNEFGATIKQKKYVDENGKLQLSAINIVGTDTKAYEEGAWNTQKKSISSQMLSKQSPALAKKQLDLTYQIKLDEFNEINSLTNPAVKKRLMESFADDCDSSAVHLKAAAFPRQASRVLLPSVDVKPNEVYAPTYKNGEQVALIRFPHGGIFEIPTLRVNNKGKVAKEFGNLEDAIVINPKTAHQLSGADFDGDSALVIPMSSAKISASSSLKQLKGFEPKEAYPGYSGMKTISSKNKQTEMGKVSNLITDMTIKRASQDEIARAVKHSMVVIDAEKHNLNYKQSFIDNNIAELKEKYQGGSKRGASTLISKAASEYRVDQRKDGYKVDPETGKKVFTLTGETYTNSKGKVIVKQTKSTKMYETNDAFTLSSGTPMENLYATFANNLKSLGDLSRKVANDSPSIKQSPSAKATYDKEAQTLKAKLQVANSNKPMERQAQLLANKIVQSKKDQNPDVTAADVKKIKGQALAEARQRVGAKKERIPITPKEWEAIQAGAISNNVLMQILNNTDLDVIRQYATPKTKTILSGAKLSKAKLLLDSGYTQAEVAESLGISTSTLSAALE